MSYNHEHATQDFLYILGGEEADLLVGFGRVLFSLRI